MTEETGRGWIRRVAIATLLAGTLDLLAAVLVNLDLGPRTTLQSITSGWKGPSAFEGGWICAGLGVLTHFALMAVIAAIWVLIAARLPPVRRLWPVAGVAWGAAVWTVMSLVVVPLSAAPFGVADDARAVIRGLAIHILFVGLPMAWVMRSRSQPS